MIRTDLLVDFVRWLHTDEFGDVEPGSWLEREALTRYADEFLAKRGHEPEEEGRPR